MKPDWLSGSRLDMILAVRSTSGPGPGPRDAAVALRAPSSPAPLPAHGLPRAGAPTPPITTIEAPLVRRASHGDASAFRAIFERHAPAVRRLLRDLLGDDAAADEATQETFVRAHGRLATLRETDKLLPWLFGIARNVCFEQLRVRRNQRLREEPEPEEQADAAPGPELALLGQEADAMLDRALQILSETRRTALLLRIEHGLPYEDIAEVMDWPLAKVKNEIHRARLQLRTELCKYVGGAP